MTARGGSTVLRRSSKATGCSGGTGTRPATTRRAAAVVEMAVVTPILLTMLFGVIEFGRVFMVQETITNSAREACRVAILQGSTDDEIEARFAEAMTATGLTITDGMLTIGHATTENPIVTIQVAVPYSDVTLVGDYLGLGDATLGSVCSMRKEGTM